jgi:hypothetical protein
VCSGTGASDAHADEHEAGIGGWWCPTQPPRLEHCFWFSQRLTKDLIPWIHRRDTPKQFIATFELLATAILLELAAWHKGTGHLRFSAPAFTDSQCNTYALARNYSRKSPCAEAHMELATVCDNYHIWPEISHTRREHNTWADSLANFNTKGWDPAKRWDITHHRWRILNDLVDPSKL